MTRRLLLDTNIVSHAVRGHPVVIRRLAETPISRVCVGVIT
jgi:predicted nucleic acid-binding protein